MDFHGLTDAGYHRLGTSPSFSENYYKSKENTGIFPCQTYHRFFDRQILWGSEWISQESSGWKKHSAFRFRFESFTFRQVKLEGRNLEFQVQKLELAHTQYMGLCDPNSIGVKNGIFFKMQVLNQKKSKRFKYSRFPLRIRNLLLLQISSYDTEYLKGTNPLIYSRYSKCRI